MSTNFLSIALQTGSNDLLLLVLFAVMAAIFLVVFFSWYRSVNESDLEKIIEADARQTTGPALTGEVPPEHAEAEADAIADREILLAELGASHAHE